MPTTYTLVAAVMMIALHVIVPIQVIVPSPWHLFGFVPLVAGVVLNLLADNAFRNAGTTVKPLEEPTVLICDGVFRLSRNPMYLGFVAVLLGIAILLRSIAPYLVIPVFAVLMDRIFILTEERSLERRFGEAWVKYSLRVRRWL
jgi:protein-S-isoprenylcysteine O-methyltransferase Ste14